MTTKNITVEPNAWTEIVAPVTEDVAYQLEPVTNGGPVYYRFEESSPASTVLNGHLVPTKSFLPYGLTLKAGEGLYVLNLSSNAVELLIS